MRGPKLHGADLRDVSLGKEYTGEFPATPVEGQLCYRDNELYIYSVNNEIGEWKQLTNSADQQIEHNHDDKYIIKTGDNTISGHLLPATTGTVNLGSDTNRFESVYVNHLFTSGNSIYVNNKPVIKDIDNTIQFSTSENQDVLFKTTTNGRIRQETDDLLLSSAKGGMEFTTDNTKLSKHIDFTNYSTNGDIAFVTNGQNGAIQLISTNEIDIQAPTIYMLGEVLVNGMPILTDNGESITDTNKLMIDSADATPDYLINKIEVDNPLKIVKTPGTGVQVPLTSLSAQYLFNEATSGILPTKVLDKSTTTNQTNLDIVYLDNNLQFNNISSGSYLQFNNVWGRSTISTEINTSKRIYQRLNYRDSITLEFVVNFTTIANWQPFFNISQSNTHKLGLIATTDGNLIPVFNNKNTGSISCGINTSGRTVIHMVIDTNQITQEERIRIYINGTRLGYTAMWDMPTEAEILDLTNSNIMSFMNTGGYNSHKGNIYYFAAYNNILSNQQIQDHYNRLLLNDDISPAYTINTTNSKLKISQPSYYYSQDDSTISSTSTTYQDRLVLSFDITSTGLYRLGWSTKFHYNHTTSRGIVRILLNGVEIDRIEQRPNDTTSTVRFNYSGFYVSSLNIGTNIIKMQIAVSSNNRQITTYGARLEAQQVN